MSTEGDDPWRFESLTEFLRRLDGESDEVVTDIESALAAILDDPYEPKGIVTYPLRGRDDQRQISYADRIVAQLPHDFHMTYVPIEYTVRASVIYRRRVIVYSFDKVPDLSL